MLGLPCPSRSLPTMPHAAPCPGAGPNGVPHRAPFPCSIQLGSANGEIRKREEEEGGQGTDSVSLPGRSPRAGHGHPHASGAFQYTTRFKFSWSTCAQVGSLSFGHGMGESLLPLTPHTTAESPSWAPSCLWTPS